MQRKIKKPLLSEAFLKFMDQFLGKKKDKLVLETGSGGSTLWFAERAKFVVSFEHNRGYFLAVNKAIQKQRCKNVKLYFHKTYWGKNLRKFSGSFDLVLIDGRERVRCVMELWTRVKPGGYFVLDDAHRRRYREACDFLDSKKWKKLQFSTTSRCGRVYVWQRPQV